MADLLGDVTGLSLLEPSVGTGSLLKHLHGIPRHIAAIDVDAEVLREAKGGFPHLPVETTCTDFLHSFLDDLVETSAAALRNKYDAVLSNPPYGLYLSKEMRAQLKKTYPELYVRESYGLFLIFSLTLLLPNGRYVFLLPDTFLTSKNHAPLRRVLINSAAPSRIIRFPSKRFGTVNFGYGSMCIIAGNRRKMTTTSTVQWTDIEDTTTALLDTSPITTASVNYETLITTLDTGWVNAASHPNLTTCGNWTLLGEISECRTGIYTGDNETFIGYDPSRVNRRLNGHPLLDWKSSVCTRALTPTESIEGLDEIPSYVPFVRGGHRPFSETTAWAIRWDKKAVEFYRTNKKARLQNAKYYFQPGLAVPMVTSKRLSASLLSQAIFDQGVVGIFPKDESHIPALLLYLNSTIASSLRNQLRNGGANNSANYLKRLPAPIISKNQATEAKAIVDRAIATGQLTQSECDDYVSQFFVTTPNMLSGPSAAPSKTDRNLVTNLVPSL